MKLKVKSSAKIKRRYLLIDGKKQEIESAILDYIGILGWAKASPVFSSEINNNQVLSVDRKEVTSIRAALEASSYKLKTLRVSGTLKGLKN